MFLREITAMFDDRAKKQVGGSTRKHGKSDKYAKYRLNSTKAKNKRKRAEKREKKFKKRAAKRAESSETKD